MLKKIYKTFLQNYGRQGWWPVTKEGIHPQYSGGPTNDKEKLEVMFGAILTQNTSWKNVEKAIAELNKNNLIAIDKILDIETNKLAQLIKSSGYYNQKAKKLKRVCKFLKENPIDDLDRLDITDLRQKLLDVKGIGAETADSIILYAFNKPSFVVDTYTKRIFSRVGAISKNQSYDKIKEYFEDKLEKDSELFNEYHALIVEHAKKYCRKKPLCEECIINNICEKRI